MVKIKLKEVANELESEWYDQEEYHDDESGIFVWFAQKVIDINLVWNKTLKEVKKKNMIEMCEHKIIDVIDQDSVLCECCGREWRKNHRGEYLLQ